MYPKNSDDWKCSTCRWFFPLVSSDDTDADVTKGECRGSVPTGDVGPADSDVVWCPPVVDQGYACSGWTPYDRASTPAE